MSRHLKPRHLASKVPWTKVPWSRYLEVLSRYLTVTYLRYLDNLDQFRWFAKVPCKNTYQGTSRYLDHEVPWISLSWGTFMTLIISCDLSRYLVKHFRIKVPWSWCALEVPWGVSRYLEYKSDIYCNILKLIK